MPGAIEQVQSPVYQNHVTIPHTVAVWHSISAQNSSNRSGWLLGKHTSQGNTLYLAGCKRINLFLICKNHFELSLGTHVKT